MKKIMDNTCKICVIPDIIRKLKSVFGFIIHSKYFKAQSMLILMLSFCHQNVYLFLGSFRIGRNVYRPFYRFGGHIEFIKFMEYYGMPRGYSLSIFTRFSGKKKTSMYISREKRDHYYIQTRHKDLFFPLQSFSRKT